MVASLISNALGSKSQPKDFMPHAQKEDDTEIPLETAMQEWR